MTPASLSTRLQPPPEGIASRVLLKAAGGSATAFAFAEGEGLDEHSTPREALLLVTEGRARVTLAGETYDLGPTDAIRLPASVPHAVHATEALQMVLLLFRS